MSKKTIKDMLIEYRGYIIFVPKGSTTNHRTAFGDDENYNFLCWSDTIKVFYQHEMTLVDTSDGGMFRHDFEYYGINIKSGDVK